MPEKESKKRGRPPNYASKEAKARAEVQRKRQKRQSHAFLQRARQHDQFYNAEAPSIPLSLPPSLSARQALDNLLLTSTHPPEQVLLPDNDYNHVGFGDDLDLSVHLPPPTPPLDPVPEAPARQRSEMPPTNLSPSSTRAEYASDFAVMSNNLLEDETIEVEPQGGRPAEAATASTAEHRDRVDYVARRLTDDLIKFQGCCANCHALGEEEHNAKFEQHLSLAQYLDSMTDRCSDILGTPRVTTRQDDLANKVDAKTRRDIFSGLTSDDSAQGPPHICLRVDEAVSASAGVYFDVDSITGLPSDLAVAKEGVRWHPTQMPVSDLRSSLHLNSRKISYLDEAGRLHQVHRPVHQIPHYTFGRLVGFEDISLYFLFPHLYRERQQSSRLRDEDFRVWMDDILLPIIYKHYSSSHAQHYPSSFDHSRYNATARGVETRGQRVDPVSREQQLMSYLPPESLAKVWESILVAVKQPGLRQFRDVTILLQAKNLKVLTKDTTWERMMTRFSKYWLSAIDEDYVTSDFYFDIATEICPTQASRVASSVPTPSTPAEVDGHGDGDEPEDDSPAETLLWKRCCLETWSSWMQQGPARDPTRKEVFYPFSMLQDSGSLSVESSPHSWLRSIGLLFTQRYPSVKEIFAAGNVYPFTNTAIETLALDKSLRRTWELVGGGLSHNPTALMKAYLYTKLRCHFALSGSIKKSFGVRTEHRVSRELFRAIDKQFRALQQHNQRLTSTSGIHAPYYRFTTKTLLRWLRWNINKFCFGFEMVHSFQDPHFVTWEHTRVMLALLRCLQFSCPSGLIQKVGGCWQDVRFQTDSRQPDGLRRVEGLGFRRTMEDFGYAWFLDKIDWDTLTFRQPHAAHMMFNNPSMQAAYHARYGQVRDVRLDFIRMDKARQWMIEFSAVPACLAFLEKYLRQLCLCAFRKDVFRHIKSFLDPKKAEAALAGEVPLCYATIKAALKKEYRPPKLAHGNRLGVKSMDVLFSWLWEWNDGQFERKAWDDKPYRMLFRQSYRAVDAARGKSGARTFRQELKKSFVRSHFIVPYPQNTGFMRKDKDTKDFVWWPSFHDGLHAYYKRFGTGVALPDPLPASYVKHHPADGWRLAPESFLDSHMPYVVQPEQRLLHLSESELYQELVRFRDQWVADVPEITPPAMPVLEFNIRSASYIGPTAEWCSKARGWVVKPFEKCQTAGECSLFLRQELEKYEILQHQRQYRRRGRGRRRPDFHSDSDSDLSSTSADATSDEESLGARREQQGRVVKRMEARMRELMERELEDWQKRREMYRPEETKTWRKPGEYLEKEFNHRLRQVKS